jgi:hypothetical protein
VRRALRWLWIFGAGYLAASCVWNEWGVIAYLALVGVTLAIYALKLWGDESD